MTSPMYLIGQFDQHQEKLTPMQGSLLDSFQTISDVYNRFRWVRDVEDDAESELHPDQLLCVASFSCTHDSRAFRDARIW